MGRNSDSIKNEPNMRTSLEERFAGQDSSMVRGEDSKNKH
jgi:hypothetical protein